MTLAQSTQKNRNLHQTQAATNLNAPAYCTETSKLPKVNPRRLAPKDEMK
jgi:hypothetical protein